MDIQDTMKEQKLIYIRVFYSIRKQTASDQSIENFGKQFIMRYSTVIGVWVQDPDTA